MEPAVIITARAGLGRVNAVFRSWRDLGNAGIRDSGYLEYWPPRGECRVVRTKTVEPTIKGLSRRFVVRRIEMTVRVRTVRNLTVFEPLRPVDRGEGPHADERLAARLWPGAGR